MVRRVRGRRVVVGTRGSELALIQARMAAEVLLAKCGFEVRTDVIRTRGDEANRAPIANEIREIPPQIVEVTQWGPSASPRVSHGHGRKGIFTAELERALLERRIDVAVHSAKDLPSEMDPRITIAAVLPRGAVHDLLVMKKETSLSSLPHGAQIASGSVRRQRQLKWVRPDIGIPDLRGNVPTRLRKLTGSDWDAIVLAQAGLERLRLSESRFKFEEHEFFAEVLPVEVFVPAGGQGIIALQTRVEDAELFLEADEGPTHDCLRAERAFLRLLQGDCNLPVGAYARFIGGEIELRAQLFADSPAPKMASTKGRQTDEIAKAVFLKISGD